MKDQKKINVLFRLVLLLLMWGSLLNSTSSQSGRYFVHNNYADTTDISDMNALEFEAFIKVNKVNYYKEEVYASTIYRVRTGRLVTNNTILNILEGLSSQKLIDSLYKYEYPIEPPLLLKLLSGNRSLPNYKSKRGELSPKEDLMEQVFTTREYFFKQLVQLQTANYHLAMRLRHTDPELALNFLREIYKVRYFDFSVGDIPAPDTRLSAPLYALQKKAFYPLMEMMEGNKDGLATLTNTFVYWACCHVDPEIKEALNKVLKRNGLDPVD